MNSNHHLRSSLLGLAALALGLTAPADGAARLRQGGASTAGFRATGPGGFGITGTTTVIAVADDGATVTVTVPLGGLATGISLRDEHTRKALEVATYPNARLEVARSALRFPAKDAESSGDAKGAMTVHGVTRDVSFHYRARPHGDKVAVGGSARINMTEFGVKPPSYLGISVKPEVEVFAEFLAADD